MKNLDWGSLSFGYMKTDYNVRCYYRDGKTRVYSAHYWQRDGNIAQEGETWTVSPDK